MVSSSLVAAALAVLAPAGPESPMTVAKKAVGEYRKAMLHKDLAYFEKNSTDDFVDVGPKGAKVPKAHAIEGIRQGFAMFKKIERFEVKIVSARRAEGGVLVVSDNLLIAEVAMGKKTGKMVSNFRYETLLVPGGKGWLYKRVKILKDDTKIDGKPMKTAA